MTHRLRGRVLRVSQRLGGAVERFTTDAEAAAAEQMALEEEMERYEVAARRLLKLLDQGDLGWSFDPSAMVVLHQDGRVEPIEDGHG